MILCDDRRFAFIHVPKCAGTSVRRALAPLDSTGEAFFTIVDHPRMGPVHLAHLTMADLALHYPETFARVRRYRSMAILRDPLERFYSALFQRLREFRHVPQSDLTPTVIKAEAERVIGHLDGKSGRLDLEHVHFTRQSEFVEIDGQRIVSDLFAVDDMDSAVAHVLSLTGVDIADQRENRTTALRFAALRPLQKAFRGPYSRLVPAELRDKIRQRMTAAGLYAPVAKDRFVEPGGVVDQFVRHHYDRDFQLLAEVGAARRARAA